MIPNTIKDDFHNNGPRYHGSKVTREEYLDLENEGIKYDMIDGVLYMAPSPSFEHGNCQIKIISILQLYLNTNKTGKLTAETDMFLPDGGDVIRPDICFIKKENLNIEK